MFRGRHTRAAIVITAFGGHAKNTVWRRLFPIGRTRNTFNIVVNIALKQTAPTRSPNQPNFVPGEEQNLKHSNICKVLAGCFRPSLTERLPFRNHWFTRWNPERYLHAHWEGSLTKNDSASCRTCWKHTTGVAHCWGRPGARQIADARFENPLPLVSVVSVNNRPTKLGTGASMRCKSLNFREMSNHRVSSEENSQHSGNFLALH